MKCEVEDCPEGATAAVNETVNLCDGHLHDYLDSPNQAIFRYFDRRRNTAYEAILKMSDLPREKILDVIRSIKAGAPDRYPPTRYLLFETGRRMDGFPGSQDTLKVYLDKLVAEGLLVRKSEPYRSAVVPFRTRYMLAEDARDSSR